MKKIPAIPKIPEQILKAASKGELVIFFGAGVSRIIGCPSWQEFAHKYLDKILENKKINHFEYERLSQKDPRMVLTICQKIMQEEGVTPPDVSEILKGDVGKIKEYKIYDQLYKLNAIFVTTNFDTHMDDVIIKNRPKPISPQPLKDSETSKVIQESQNKQDIYYAEEEFLLTALNNKSLIHLHGSVVDAEKLVITLPDYIKRYEADTKPDVLLKEIFDKKTVLFIGYGLEEYEIIEFLVKKSSDISEGVIKHYMLFGAFEEEENVVELYKKYYATLGIELRCFSRTKRGYPQMVNVIKAWAKKIGPMVQDPDYLQRRDLMEGVD